MPFCSIITDFKIEHFEKIKESIFLNDTVIITNDFSIQEQIQDLGYKVEHIESHFGYVNDRIYSIYKKSIENTEMLYEHLQEIKYKDVSLVEGLKFFILIYFMFLEQIKSILEERKNFVFIFPNTEYYYFVIEDIAQNLGYETNLGTSCVTNSDLLRLNFDGTSNSNSRFLYHDTRFLYDKHIETSKNDKEISNILLHLEIDDVEYAFFLNDNLYGLYLKPVMPLIRMFEQNKIPYDIFTLDEWSSKWLTDKGLKIHNLAVFIDRISKITLQEFDVILNFIDKIQSFETNDYLIQSFCKIFRNDSIARYLSRIMALINVIDYVFQKNKVKSVIVALDGGTPDNDVVFKVAKKHEILTNSIMIQSYTQHMPYLGYILNADRIFVGGNRLKNELMELGVENKRLVITGNPRYDYIQSLYSHENESKKTCVLVGISRWQNEEEWLPDLIRFCNEKQIDIIVKLHPMYKFVLQKLSNSIIEKIQKQCSGLNFKILFDPEIEMLLQKSDIVIITMPSSTVGFEASLHNIPIIVTNMNNQKFHDLAFGYQKEGVALYATSLQELFISILQIINDENVKGQLQKFRNEFNSNLNYNNDGKATDRIFHYIVENRKYKESFTTYMKKLFTGIDHEKN